MPRQIRHPADPSSGSVAQFGYDLRVLRQQAGKTYAVIAVKTYYSKSAMHAVDQGHALPSASLLEAFVTECGGDVAQWQTRRKSIAEQIAATKGPPVKTNPRAQGLPPPDPHKAVTTADYNDALKRLREWSGLSYMTIYRITVDYPRQIAPSTLCGAFSRGTLPSRDLVESLLRALDLDQDEQRTWLTMWETIKEGHPAHTLLRWRTHTDHDLQNAIAGPDTQQDVPDEQETPPVMLYNPSIEVHDWVLVNGAWRSKPRRAPLARLPPLTTRRVTTLAALITLLVLIGVWLLHVY